MLFDSWKFIYFLLSVLMGYYIVPKKSRNFYLLCSSYYFYMQWNKKYLVLIMTSTIITYISSILIFKFDKPKKVFLILSTSINILILFVFKYYNFFAENIIFLAKYSKLDWEIKYLNLLLPVGISFYTFQAISYTIDVYKGRIEPEKNIINYSLFVSFFPQLVAGPIERSSHLLPQLKNTTKQNFPKIKESFGIIIIGYLKKIVISERLAYVANRVFSNPSDFSSLSIIIGIFFFGFQIYCDFSAYTDIARGVAKLFGINLMENFNRPYQSQSISEFWKRWHISLSTWFRDYIYIPLGGKRKNVYLNILIVFMLSGLWHGARITFVIWGLIHALLMIGENLLKVLKLKIYSRFNIKENMKILNRYKILKVISVFLLVNLTWIFFRADNLGDALIVVRKVTNIGELLFDLKNYSNSLMELRISKLDFLINILLLFALEFSYLAKEKLSRRKVFIKNRPYIVSLYYYFIIFLIMVLGRFDSTQFIYFQF